MRNRRGKTEHGMFGRNGNVGQNGTGQNGTIPSYPKGVSFCPNGLVHFTPRPYYLQNVSDESD